MNIFGLMNIVANMGKRANTNDITVKTSVGFQNNVNILCMCFDKNVELFTKFLIGSYIK